MWVTTRGQDTRCLTDCMPGLSGIGRYVACETALLSTNKPSRMQGFHCRFYGSTDFAGCVCIMAGDSIRTMMPIAPAQLLQ